jgi:hypothetical protein
MDYESNYFERQILVLLCKSPSVQNPRQIWKYMVPCEFDRLSLPKEALLS